MANWSGIAASLSAIVRPSILEPRLVVSFISQLDFLAFKQRGVVGVVIDKDNCITVPHKDQLAPTLEGAWQDLLDTFGSDNVLIVSNSVGTLAKDPALLGAESVSRNLRVPVLAHQQPKPGPKCVEQIARHFDQLSSATATTSSQIVYSSLAQSRRSLPSTTAVSPGQHQSESLKILVIGDRLATDLILSHRLSQLSLPLPQKPSSILSRLLRRQSTTEPSPSKRRRIETVGILTTGLHEKEGFGTTFLRGIEKLALRRLEKKRKRLGLDWETPSAEKWEECLKGHQPTLSLSPAARIEEPPSTATTKSTPNSSAPEFSQRQSQRTRRSFAPKFIASISTLSTLPHTLPHLFRRLPHSILSSLKSLPSTTYSLLRRTISSTFDHFLEKLPFIAEKLYKPMNKLVGVYTRPQELAGAGVGMERQVVQRKTDGGLGGGRVDKVIDRVEEIVRQARETVAKRERAKST
ncbi:phosphatidylglycerophosphatase [Sporobolomyces salmoneus]|uniref:phosphatidylglycerophosphatase n=1 Tax=Sporobolomyces salmoneus TaxID=183962 RepID=UPI00317B486E